MNGDEPIRVKDIAGILGVDKFWKGD